MNQIKNFLWEKWSIFTIVILAIIITFLSYFAFFLPSKSTCKNDNKTENLLSVVTEEEQTEELESCTVDLKGAVKKPGVYQLVKNSTINDLIELAGGLNKDATTKNINLSKKLTDEMVIYVYTKNELKKSTTLEIKECQSTNYLINDCLDEYSSVIETNNSDQTEVTNKTNQEENNNLTEQNSLININTASKEILMNLSGIGESKANSIIEYRNLNGNFQTIEELKKVSGIGETIFEKIKANICVS